MNHKKIIIGLLVALVVTVIILFAVGAAKAKKDKEAKEKEEANSKGDTPTPIKPGLAPAIVNDYPIVYMKYSEAAKQLQAAVGTTQDGKIGDKTLEAWNKLIASVKGNPATKSFKIKNEAVMIAYLAEIKKAKTLAAAAKAAADKFASYK